MAKTFESVVRNQPAPFGKFGKVVSKELAEFIGKRVKITVEVIKEI